MKWASVGALLVVLLLYQIVTGYFGYSRIAAIAAIGMLWLAISVAISFVGDRRYTRAFSNKRLRERFSGAARSPRLSIGRALLIGEFVVNIPVVFVLVGLIAALGSLFQGIAGYDGTGRAPAFPTIASVLLAFTAAWGWWAIATPRRLLWAMKRVSDPIALRRAAVGSILWPEGRWGRVLNKTQWRSVAMQEEERQIVFRSTRGRNIGE